MNDLTQRLESLSTLCRELQTLYDLQREYVRDLRNAGVSVLALCAITQLSRARIYQLLDETEKP